MENDVRYVINNAVAMAKADEKENLKEFTYS
jgi:hypothetical protein